MSFKLRQRSDDSEVLLRKENEKLQAERDKEKMANVFKDINPLEESSWFSRLTFAWTNPAIEHAKKY